jgi:hypothetical protein
MYYLTPKNAELKEGALAFLDDPWLWYCDAYLVVCTCTWGL